jgi:hypothetical protein
MVDYRDFEEERLREFDSFVNVSPLHHRPTTEREEVFLIIIIIIKYRGGGGGVCLIRIIEGCHNE